MNDEVHQLFCIAASVGELFGEDRGQPVLLEARRRAQAHAVIAFLEREATAQVDTDDLEDAAMLLCDLYPAEEGDVTTQGVLL